MNQIHDQFDAVFESLFGESSIYETVNLKKSNRISKAAFRNRFPALNQRLLKRFSYCVQDKESPEESKFGQFNAAKNPKMRIKQAVKAYINWTNLHLANCTPPFNKQLSREHMVRTGLGLPYLAREHIFMLVKCISPLMGFSALNRL